MDQQHVLDQLIRADLFEQVLQQRYLGNKRFSLEGVTALIPLVDEILDAAGQRGAVNLVMGMSHRGRLNVIVHIARRAPEEVFAGFEDVDPRSVLGSGDVKYHMGATGEYVTRSGAKVQIHLVSNPSHLEAVDPVTVGRTRAKQDRDGEDGWEKYHASAGPRRCRICGAGNRRRDPQSFRPEGYTGGWHDPHHRQQSAWFYDALQRRTFIPFLGATGAPAVHSDLPRQRRRCGRGGSSRPPGCSSIVTRYKGDVVIDLIGYRRHGHSEVDDPTVTQPLLYRAIKDHPPLWEIYAEDTGAENVQAHVEEVRAELEAAQKKAKSIRKKPRAPRPAQVLG